VKMAKDDDSPLTVVDWMIDHSGANLRNYSDFQEDIISIAKRETAAGKPQLEAYLKSSKSDSLQDKSTESQRTVKEAIDNVNKEWSDKVVGDINKVNIQDDLDTIKDSDLEPNRKTYNNKTIEEVEKAIKDKEKELEKLPPPIDRKRIRELESDIEKADTQADIDKLFTRGGLRRELGTAEANRIIDLSDDRASELKTLSDEAFDNTSKEIDSVTTTDGLYEISGRLTEIPNLTMDNRKALAISIRERIKELGG